MPKLVRAVLWQIEDRPGSEYLGLWQDGEGWQLRGTIVLAVDGVPTRLRYAVAADGHWRTEQVHVAVKDRGPERVAHFSVDRERRWTIRGQEVRSLAGCVDVDLSTTPSGCILPIRRAALEIGEATSDLTARLHIPDLVMEPVSVRYLRQSERRYLREVGREGVELEVDDLGLVTSYGERWRRAGSIDEDQ